jgi:membrane associated rhomboid family serine protease
MSIYDRDYQRADQSRMEYFSSGGPFANLPPMTRYILIVNVAVFMLTFLIPPLHRWINLLFSVYPVNYWSALQVWRLITYQFVHHDFFHIFFNMLGLYFLGPLIEGFWGSRLFLRFYLISGAMGGIVYTLLALFGVLPAGPMVWASGAIYGLMAVAVVMFPRMRVYLFIIPMNILTMVGLLAIISAMNFLSGTNAGGEAAHLTGLGVGLFYVYVKPRLTALRMSRSQSAWQKKIKQQQDFEVEVDRILEKVHQSGIGNLTAKEKKILQEATRREQQQTAHSR